MLKPFLLKRAEQLRQHAFEVARKAGRPCTYLMHPTRKEDLARETAAKDGVESGLVCIFSVVEPCRTFSFVWKERKPFIRPAKIGDSVRPGEAGQEGATDAMTS